MNDKLINCKACGAEISKNAKSCPHCGEMNKKPIYKKWWFWLIVFIFICSLGSGDDTKSASKTSNPSTQTASVETSNMTMGQKNALSSAKSYLKFMAFSKSGLIEQLVYEGHTTEDATFAVNNCGADWYEQAVKCAESYLKHSSFSKEGLIDQLKYEGFTYDQAIHGVEENWY